MNVVGIIAEYNPFHNGHVYQINKIKKLFKNSIIIVILNGNFTQRADVSVINKWDKTRILLDNNVDMVVELPIYYGINNADIFAEGDKIDVTAKSKGKGYAGGLKRHGLKSGPSGHGSKYHRHAGSNGSATTPGRVFKGKKMPGHMGSVRVTIQNLEVVKIDVENNVILVKGAVPGPKKSLVMIKDTVKSGK